MWVQGLKLYLLAQPLIDSNFIYQSEPTGSRFPEATCRLLLQTVFLGKHN